MILDHIEKLVKDKIPSTGHVQTSPVFSTLQCCFNTTARFCQSFFNIAQNIQISHCHINAKGCTFATKYPLSVIQRLLVQTSAVQCVSNLLMGEVVKQAGVALYLVCLPFLLSSIQLFCWLQSIYQDKPKSFVFQDNLEN